MERLERGLSVTFGGTCGWANRWGGKGRGGLSGRARRVCRPCGPAAILQARGLTPTAAGRLGQRAPNWSRGRLPPNRSSLLHSSPRRYQLKLASDHTAPAWARSLHRIHSSSLSSPVQPRSSPTHARAATPQNRSSPLLPHAPAHSRWLSPTRPPPSLDRRRRSSGTTLPSVGS